VPEAPDRGALLSQEPRLGGSELLVGQRPAAPQIRELFDLLRDRYGLRRSRRRLNGRVCLSDQPPQFSDAFLGLVEGRETGIAFGALKGSSSPCFQ